MKVKNAEDSKQEAPENQDSKLIAKIIYKITTTCKLVSIICGNCALSTVCNCAVREHFAVYCVHRAPISLNVD